MEQSSEVRLPAINSPTLIATGPVKSFAVDIVVGPVPDLVRPAEPVILPVPVRPWMLAFVAEDDIARLHRNVQSYVQIRAVVVEEDTVIVEEEVRVVIYAHAANEACPVEHLSGAMALYAALVAKLNGKV